MPGRAQNWLLWNLHPSPQLSVCVSVGEGIIVHQSEAYQAIPQQEASGMVALIEKRSE